ncbi:MAG: hypothetical protein R2864_12615 [Syntrophotaleaceae bacterium]
MTNHLRQNYLPVITWMSKGCCGRWPINALPSTRVLSPMKTVHASLMIDFSRCVQTGQVGTRRFLRGSAYGALLALENEAGVSQLKSEISTMCIAGSRKAVRIDASYLVDDCTCLSALSVTGLLTGTIFTTTTSCVTHGTETK